MRYTHPCGFSLQKGAIFNMDEIRTLARDELRAAFELGQFAFQSFESDEQRERRIQEADPGEIWGFFVDGSLAARLSLLPLRAYVGGVSFAMGGVAGVATWPEYRRQGLVAALLRKALAVMRESGQTISMLAPFSFAFYRRFGWEHCVDRKHITVKADQLPARVPYPGCFERSRDLAALRSVYDAFAGRYCGMLDRDDPWWQTHVLRDERLTVSIYRDESRVPAAYVIYSVKDRILNVKDWAVRDESARRALWSYIAQHDSMIDSVRLLTPVSDRLASRLENPRIGQEIESYFMARIVDVAAFLSQYPFHEGVKNSDREKFALRITDDICPWNDGLFELRIGAVAPARAVKSNEAYPSDTPVIECDVRTLAILLFRYMTAEELLDAGRLNGDREAALQLAARLPAQEAYLADFF